MDLTLPEVAELLGVSEATVKKWVAEGCIPSYQLNQSYRFNRLELEDWVMNVNQGGGQFLVDHGRGSVLSQGVWHQFGLYRAIHKGGVITGTTTQDKDLLIKEVMTNVADRLSLDDELVSELVLAREKLMPTALGNGIAVPHTRDFLLTGLFDAVTFVFPSTPVDWGSLDGIPVHTIVFLFACDDRRHLNLLAKLAHLASNPESLTFLQSRPGKESLLEFIKQWESSVVQQAAHV